MRGFIVTIGNSLGCGFNHIQSLLLGARTIRPRTIHVFVPEQLVVDFENEMHFIIHLSTGKGAFLLGFSIE